MGFQPFYGQGPRPILWAGTRVACGKITVSGIRNFGIYCIFILDTQYTNVTRAAKYNQAGRELQTHALGNSGCTSLPNVLIFHSQLTL
jgi:hypothetical protein